MILRVNGMTAKMGAHGKLYLSKRKVVFVASPGGACPTINVPDSSKLAKLRDDYSKGLKIPKQIARLAFR